MVLSLIIKLINQITNWFFNSEDNDQRTRLMLRQKQIFENKLQRQHQIVATSTRPPSGRLIWLSLKLICVVIKLFFRPFKSARNRSADRLIDFDTASPARSMNSKSTESIGLDNLGLQVSKSIKSMNHQQNDNQFQDDNDLSDFKFDSNNMSANSSPELIESQNKETKRTIKSGTKKNVIQNQDNKSKKLVITTLDGDDKSDDESSDIDSPSSKGLSLMLSPDKRLNYNQQQINLNNLNPLDSVLTNKEMLAFVTQAISPETTLQCSIIRDKKGIDRSLYPTYYMHLQGKQL